MSEIILSPSILAADYLRLGEQLKALDQAGAPYVHVDVMDGLFVPSISLGMPVITSIRKGTDRVFDVHLMINEPGRYAEEFVKAGADIVTFHYEACADVAETIRLYREKGVKVGLSVKPATPIEVVYPYLKDVDMILVMTVEPGFGGQKLIPETLDKVRTLRAYCEAQGMNMDIQVDGGITLENFRDAVSAGANVLVAGTAVFHGDIQENIKTFLATE